MTEYQVGKDIEKIEQRLKVLETMLEEIYSVVKYNFDTGVLKEPKIQDKKE